MAFTFACFLFVFCSGLVCNGSDTLLPGQSLFTNQTLVSKGGKFELGFFNSGNSTNYYIGIWYKHIPVRTVVWVYNRDDPIPHSHYNYSRVELLSNGSLYVYLGVERIWYYFPIVSEAVILDTGNFVFRDSSGGIVWQSFDYPTDTWLPGMKLYDDFRFNGLVSWTNPNDPASGNYALVVDSGEVSTRFNREETLWSSGALQGGAFASLPDYSSFRISYNFTHLSSDTYGYLMYNVYNESLVLRIVIDYLGRLTHFGWSEATHAWIILSCNGYPTCRPNTICNADYSPACRCLDGFVPRVKRDWDLSDFSNGCGRTTPLECGEAEVKPDLEM